MVLHKSGTAAWRLRTTIAVLRSHLRHYGYVHVPKKRRPHILGPSYLWRKCFVVHPASQALAPLTKFQWLTRTSVVDGLPDRSIDLPDDTLIEDLESRLSDAIAFYSMDHPGRVGRQTESQLGRMTGRYERDRLASGVLQNILSTLWMLGHPPHLRQSSLTINPEVECYWRCAGEPYLCQPKPLFILHAANPLELFSTPDAHPGTGTPEQSYRPEQLRVWKRSFDQIQPFGGCKRLSPFNFAHTVFAHDTGGRSRDQIVAHGLMQLFAQSAAQTVQHGFRVDKDLIHPLSSQGVVTNGKDFTFLCYQLNTLDTSGRGGRENFLWAGPTLSLFQTVELGKGLTGFNQDCARMLLEFLSYEPTRRRPSVSGFTLTKRAKKAAEERREEFRRKYRQSEQERYWELRRAKRQQKVAMASESF